MLPLVRKMSDGVPAAHFRACSSRRATVCSISRRGCESGSPNDRGAHESGPEASSRRSVAVEDTRPQAAIPAWSNRAEKAVATALRVGLLRQALTYLSAEMTSPVISPVKLRLYACATLAAGTPFAGSRPMAASVSATQPGLTAFTRTLPRHSSAADRTKASTPAFTMLTAALPSMGRCARTPLVRVSEPPTETRPTE
jgi:hypothetical protein